MSVPLSGHCYRYWHCSALVDPATLPQFWLCAAAAHLSIVLKQNSCWSCYYQLQMVSSLKCGTLKIVFPRLLVARWRREQSCYFDGLLVYEAKQASHSTPLQVTVTGHWQVSSQEEREGQQWRSLEGERAQIVGKWQMQSLSCRGWKARGCWSSNEAAVGGAAGEVGGKGEAGQCAQHVSRKKFAQLGL